MRALPQEKGQAPCLSLAVWPDWDEAHCVDQVITVPIQVNGRVRARMELARDASEDAARILALSDPVIAQLLEGKDVQKFVYVSGRICNFITK